MADRKRVDVFCEDTGHEEFVRAALERLATEAGIRLDIRIRSASGGHGRALTKLDAYIDLLKSGTFPGGLPDLLVVVIDGNCTGWHTKLKEVAARIPDNVVPHLSIGCPDPHVERWCIADPQGFADVVGARPESDPGKCERALYKHLMRRSIEDAGEVILTDEMEFAPDIVREMDFFRAGKNQASLKNFLDELAGCIGQLAET